LFARYVLTKESREDEVAVKICFPGIWVVIDSTWKRNKPAPVCAAGTEQPELMAAQREVEFGEETHALLTPSRV